MKTITTMTAAAIISSASFTATAADLTAMQAHTIDLGSQTAVVYYTTNKGLFEVVTTIASNNGIGTPIRYSTTLNPGQASALSLADVNETVLNIFREGDIVRVESNSTIRIGKTQQISDK